MNKIALVGYGGHAFVLAEIAVMNDYELIGYFDKGEKKNNPFNLPHLGTEIAFPFEIANNIYCILCIGDNRIRRKVCETLIHKNVKYPMLQHPKSAISSLSTIGEGTVIAASCAINPFVKIGQHVICNTGCLIDHECVVENFVHIAPGAVLAGNVYVGEGAFIGANSVIKEGIRIGQNAVIGAGSV